MRVQRVDYSTCKGSTKSPFSHDRPRNQGPLRHFEAEGHPRSLRNGAHGARPDRAIAFEWSVTGRLVHRLRPLRTCARAECRAPREKSRRVRAMREHGGGCGVFLVVFCCDAASPTLSPHPKCVSVVLTTAGLPMPMETPGDDGHGICISAGSIAIARPTFRAERRFFSATT